jgi:hypothetical protein
MAWGGDEVRYAVGLDATVDRLVEIARAEGREAYAAFVLRAQRFLEDEGMAKQSPTFRDFNPTGDARVGIIKGQADDLIRYVREKTEASGPQTQRRAALAITNIEQGAMWAVKALFSEDAIYVGDGVAGAADPTEDVNRAAKAGEGHD